MNKPTSKTRPPYRCPGCQSGDCLGQCMMQTTSSPQPTTQHTPMQWPLEFKIEASTHAGDVVILHDGKVVAEVCDRKGKRDTMEAGAIAWQIAQRHNSQPDLLGALKIARGWIEQEWQDAPVLKEIDAAIAKATGQNG